MRGLFLIIKHSRRPAPGQNPSIKDFGKTGDHMLLETSLVTTYIDNNDMIHATAVLDLNANKLIKFRYGEKTQSVYDEYSSKFKKEIDKGIDMYSKLSDADKRVKHILNTSYDSLVGNK